MTVATLNALEQLWKLVLFIAFLVGIFLFRGQIARFITPQSPKEAILWLLKKCNNLKIA